MTNSTPVLDRNETIAEIAELLHAARWSLLSETREWMTSMQRTALDAIDGLKMALADVTRRSPGMTTIRNARATAAAVRRLVLSVDEPIFRVLAACDDAAEWESSAPLYRENGGAWEWRMFLSNAQMVCATDRGEDEFAPFFVSSEQHCIMLAMHESTEYVEWRRNGGRAKR